MSPKTPTSAGAGTSRWVSVAAAVAGFLTLLVVAPIGAQQPPTVPAELHQKAFQQGSVRVMVEFEAPYVPEAHLPTAAHILAQRQSIAALQGVLQGSLRGVSHRVMRDFHGAVPVLVIQVGSDGL